MQIYTIDLTPLYIRCATEKQWRDYENSYPALFRHYYLHWADSDAKYPLYVADVIREKTLLVKSRLLSIERMLTIEGFTDEVIVTLFVGKNTTNGHAFWDEQRHGFVVWLPVESYTTANQVDIFAMHELIHALHYTRCPDLYFGDRRQMNLVGRQIITEGMATFGTMQVTGCDEVTALWADYVSQEFARRWYKQCQVQEQEILDKVLTEWNVSRIANDWFMMWDETDVTRYRGGYYAGLRVMQEINRRYKFDFKALLSLPAKEQEKLALKVISAMAGR